jgi:four helix bundle protein
MERGRDREMERWRDKGMKRIRTHTDLDVYKLAMDSAMEIFHLSKDFPAEERYSLTDQVRRSSRSVCANLAVAFRKRKYPKSFISKLSDSEGEAAETQVWLEFCYKCTYIDKDQYAKLYKLYNDIIGKLVNMSLHPEKWSF